MQLTEEQLKAFGETLDRLMNGRQPAAAPKFGFLLVVGALEGNSFVRYISNLSDEGEEALANQVSNDIRKRRRAERKAARDAN